MQPELRIYIDGQLDYKATYMPVIKKKLNIYWDQFNQLFVR